MSNTEGLPIDWPVGFARPERNFWRKVERVDRPELLKRYENYLYECPDELEFTVAQFLEMQDVSDAEYPIVTQSGIEDRDGRVAVAKSHPYYTLFCDIEIQEIAVNVPGNKRDDILDRWVWAIGRGRRGTSDDDGFENFYAIASNVTKIDGVKLSFSSSVELLAMVRHCIEQYKLQPEFEMVMKVKLLDSKNYGIPKMWRDTEVAERLVKEPDFHVLMKVPDGCFSDFFNQCILMGPCRQPSPVTATIMRLFLSHPTCNAEILNGFCIWKEAMYSLQDDAMRHYELNKRFPKCKEVVKVLMEDFRVDVLAIDPDNFFDTGFHHVCGKNNFDQELLNASLTLSQNQIVSQQRVIKQIADQKGLPYEVQSKLEHFSMSSPPYIDVFNEFPVRGEPVDEAEEHVVTALRAFRKKHYSKFAKLVCL